LAPRMGREQSDDNPDDHTRADSTKSPEHWPPLAAEPAHVPIRRSQVQHQEQIIEADRSFPPINWVPICWLEFAAAAEEPTALSPPSWQ
jgi:hypothetical protein